jgi:thiol-disulfide isomerase/thioredoxin
MTIMRGALLVALLSLTLVAPRSAAQSRGILGNEAPSFGVTKWINLPDGKRTIDIDDFRGKVLYLYCFQSWCQGCHSRGFPTLQQLIKDYEGVDEVAFVAVQTVFEGFSTNTPDRAWSTAERYDLSIPVGHDGSGGVRSKLMGRYRTGGTPWTVIVDKQGVVRSNDFHVDAAAAHQLIDALRAQKDAPDEKKVRTLPTARGGQDLIGRPLPSLSFDRRIDDGAPADEKPKLTLYRWWTDSCPYCEASLPALEQLRTKYEPKGLRIVAVYHPKPPRAVSDEEIRRAAIERGFNGRLAVDIDWSELRKAYFDRTQGRATSVSLLVDGDGIVRFVHPGPVYFPSKEDRFSRQNEDYEMLEGAIRTLLE